MGTQAVKPLDTMDSPYKPSRLKTPGSLVTMGIQAIILKGPKPLVTESVGKRLEFSVRKHLSWEGGSRGRESTPSYIPLNHFLEGLLNLLKGLSKVFNMVFKHLQKSFSQKALKQKEA